MLLNNPSAILNRTLKIRPLADCPEAIHVLTKWFYSEWHEFDGRSMASIEAQLRENLSCDSIPITFLAHSGSKLVGTVSLDRSDLPQFSHLSHWLASLYVVPAARHAGIGNALVSHVQQFAFSRRISPLYLWTSSSTDFYKNRGWTIYKRTTYNSKPITVMRLTRWEKSTNQ